MNLKPLTQDDIAAAYWLSEEAGWNQTIQDWQLMITHGHGVGLFEADGTLVATTVVFPFEARLAWISMVLVIPARRRQGLATRLMHHCLDYIEQAGMTALLDATEAGQTVYHRLGFEDLYTISRWTGTPSLDKASAALRPVSAADLDGLATWDAARFGVNRSVVLHHCREAAPHLAHLAEENGTVTGYLLARPGRRTTQLGPLVADDAATAFRLLHHTLAQTDGPVYIDVPDAQSALTQALIETGFIRQRGFARMVNSAASPLLPPTAIYAIAGPELG